MPDRVKFSLLAAILAAIAAAPVLANQDVTGPPATQAEPAQLWEVQSSTRIANLPAAVSTDTVCISDDDLNRPPAKLGGLQCDARDFQIIGNTLTWTGTCGGASGSGTLVFSDDRKSFTGDITATDGALNTSMHVNARSIGACAK